METSAKMDLNVTEAFDIVVKKCARDFFKKMEEEDYLNKNKARDSITKLEVIPEQKKKCC